MFSLVLGGNKSGKSNLGLAMLEKESGSCCLVVTGRATDLEFNRQIREHKLSRKANLPVVEVEERLGDCLNSLRLSADAVLVDSIDFWVFTIFQQKHSEKQIEYFFRAIDLWQDKRLIFVSAEIGLGPLPYSDFVRSFSRQLGEVNQRLAKVCDDVTLSIAGQPVKIK